MRITLTNNFHATSVTLIAEEDTRNTFAGWLSPGQVKRARRDLCGCDGCQCGDDLGCRGPQHYAIEVQHDHDGKLIAKVTELVDETVVW